ncbi:hypothetical protein BDW22DRAFT_1358556 [Trametopsis cervina]|nr:hypothetical protein BDW22DRAFT_1358556 [Trametopsis cervina]
MRSALLFLLTAAPFAAASFCCQQVPKGFFCPVPPPTELNRRLTIAGRVASFVEPASAAVCCCAAATQAQCDTLCVSCSSVVYYGVGVLIGGISDSAVKWFRLYVISAMRVRTVYEGRYSDHSSRRDFRNFKWWRSVC